MMLSSLQTPRVPVKNVNQIRDLGDFCLEWPELRALVDEDVLARCDLPESSKETIRWLRILADRVARQQI